MVSEQFVSDPRKAKRALEFLLRLIRRKNERIDVLESVLTDAREAIYQARDLARVDVQFEMAELRSELTEARAAIRELEGGMATENQATITQWAEKTFGSNGTTGTIAARLNVEMAELLRAAVHYSEGSGLHSAVVDELADVQIMLIRMASLVNVHLEEAVDAKMRVNRARKWQLAGDGTGRHLRTETSPPGM